MSAVPVRVLVVEDNALMRAATCGRLCNEADIEVVGEAELASQALIRVKERTPDVVVLDLRLGGGTEEGLGLATAISERFPNVRVVVYSAYLTNTAMLDAPNIWGYVQKTDSPRLIVEAVRTVARGEPYRPPLPPYSS